jgi:hypothetical protein
LPVREATCAHFKLRKYNWENWDMAEMVSLVGGLLKLVGIEV